MLLQFEIRGNQENEKGNPIPYMRSTQAGQHLPKVQRYNAWQAYVIKQLLKVRRQEQILKEPGAARPLSGKIFESSSSIQFYMEIMIWWSKAATHGDPDNIWKGIADALFTNDVCVAPAAFFADSPDGCGRVQVHIESGPDFTHRSIFKNQK